MIESDSKVRVQTCVASMMAEVMYETFFWQIKLIHAAIGLPFRRLRTDVEPEPEAADRDDFRLNQSKALIAPSDISYVPEIVIDSHNSERDADGPPAPPFPHLPFPHPTPALPQAAVAESLPPRRSKTSRKKPVS